MIGSVVSNENVVIVCRSRICHGLKTSLLECVVIGCLGAIEGVVDMACGGAQIRVG